MKAFVDYFRLALISPELVAALAVVGIFNYWPEPFEFGTVQLSSDVKWSLGAALLPLAMLATCYQMGTDLLSPAGKRTVLLNWPDYPMFKRRIVFTLINCVIGFCLVLLGVFFVAKAKAVWGTMLIVAGLVSSAISLASIALAKWRAREILGE